MREELIRGPLEVPIEWVTHLTQYNGFLLFWCNPNYAMFHPETVAVWRIKWKV